MRMILWVDMKLRFYGESLLASDFYPKSMELSTVWTKKASQMSYYT
jgi:hypothetical protein